MNDLAPELSDGLPGASARPTGARGAARFSSSSATGDLVDQALLLALGELEGDRH